MKNNALSRFWTRLFGRKEPKLDAKVPNLERLMDPNVQQAFSNLVVHELIKDRQAERRWKVVKRTLFTTLALFGVTYYLFIYASVTGLRVSTDTAKKIGVVRVSGDIMQTSLASSEKIVPALRAAFEDKSVQTVVLAIDSPGGAPLEAERINYMIDVLRKKHGKPIYASIQNVGASAAYMIAMQTDKICAGRYSLVGSIGAVMSSWDIHKALNKKDIQQDVYASGTLKSMLNPFVAPTEAAKDKAQEMVDKAGSMFLEELRARRGKFLRDDIKYGSGEIWDGDTALQIGLIDEICTIEKIAETENAQIKEFGPGSRTITPFSLGLVEDFSKSIVNGLLRGAGEVQLKF